MASASTLQPPLNDLFSSSTLSTTSATHSAQPYHQASHNTHTAASPPTYSPSRLATSFSSNSSATVLSPAALHSLLTTRQKELSELTSLQHTALSTQLTSVTQAYQALRASYGTLKQDFLYNLNLLNERDSELTQWEADEVGRQRREEERERECVALRSEVKVRLVKEKERAEEERLRRVELTASYETKLAVMSEELGKLRVAVEEERVRGERKAEEVREEAERERRDVQRMYEARLAEEQRARMELKEALDDTIELHDRDARNAEEAVQAIAADKDERLQQLVVLQAEKKESERIYRQLKQQLHDSQEQLVAAQLQLSEVSDSSDTRYSQLARERDEAAEEWRAVVARSEEARAVREKERAEEVERRRVALVAERQREEERSAEWRRRLEEKVEEAEAERRERRKVEYEAVIVRQQAEAEREGLETRVEELQKEGERKEQEWKREVWRLTEEVKDRRDRMQRLQREKEQRREELIRLKATVDEYRVQEEQWTRGLADTQRLTDEVAEERRRSQELEEEVVRLRAEMQKKRVVESAQPAFAVHVTEEHGRNQLHTRQHRPQRPMPISTAVSWQPQQSPQRNDYSPAFSDDLGPVSLPSSQANSPRAPATSEQLQAENDSLRAAIDTMRGEMLRVVSEVEAGDVHDRREVERLRSECQRAEREREEWRVERERLLDISNRLKAELRRQHMAAAHVSHDEKEQPLELGHSAAEWRVREGSKRSNTVGDIDRVRQALNGLIHSNQQLSDNIKALSASNLTAQPSTSLPTSDIYPHVLPSSQPTPSAAPVSHAVSPRAYQSVPTPTPATVTPARDSSNEVVAQASSAAPRSASPGTSRAAHRRSSALRRLHTAELALSSASALNAEVESLSPRSDEQSPRLFSPPPSTAAPGPHSPSRDRLRLSGKRAALAQRDGSVDRRDGMAGGRAGGALASGRQVGAYVKKDKAVLSAVRSRMNLLGKVRNYAVAP